MMEDFNYKLLLIPIISAFIGWLTNWIAVKMLFHPKQPINLGFFKLQGIFYKRQKSIASKLGEMIEKKLFSHDDIHEMLTSPTFMASVLPIVDAKLEVFITTKLTGINPMFALIPESMLQSIKGKLMEEFEAFLPEVIEGASNSLNEHIDIKGIIQKKIEEFEVSQLEEILVSIMKNEFKMIEYVGGFLGFLIGMSQILLLKFI